MSNLHPSSLYLATAVLVAAQTVPPPEPLHHDEPITLERIVVTGNPDARSAFDLAQGASILSGEALHRSLQATLGETLAATPGVNTTYYGPGASRPVIRGLGGDRVRMLDNGIGTLDASNVSPDHNVSVEPLLVERIEVLRGPATLLYGSAAVGGVVNVLDNRIPTAAPARPFSGRTELRFDSAANERTGIFAVTGGGQRLAVQVNGLRSETDDVAIPGFADPANPADRGTLSNSALSTSSGSAGLTWFGATGQAGAAFSEFDTTYGVPVGEPIEIALRQRRADLRVEFAPAAGPFKDVKLRFGRADYTHSEVDSTTGRANTTFTNLAHEGRVELIQQEAGALTGTVGVQFARSDFAAQGEEVVTPPSLTQSRALFILESYQFSPALMLQFGGRYEHQSVTLGEVDPLLPAYPGYAASTGESRGDDGLSFSTGLVLYPAKDWSFGVSVASSQRLPTAQERYSHGPHGGTGSYEIGTAALDREDSLGVDVILRKRAGFVTGSIGGFVNRFRNFIFEQRDANRYYSAAGGDFRSYPVPPGDEFLPVYQFAARDALFRGGEAELEFHVVDGTADQLHVELTADYVRAQQTTDDEPLPRIPPLRVGAGLRYAHGPWSAGAGFRHAFAHDRVAPGETPTDGYTLINADVSYRLPLGTAEAEFFVHGTNLGNAEARVSTSFLKDIAPLPGRNFTAGVRVAF